MRAKSRESLAQLDTLLQSTFLDMFDDPVTNPMGWDAVPLLRIAELENGDRSSNYPSGRAFAKAVRAAGYPRGTYTLRDLRKKGLTDEALIAGAPTDKGGHRTEQMKRYYVTETLPIRAASKIKTIKHR